MVDKEKDELQRLLEPVLEREKAVLADLALSRYKSNVTVKLFVYSEQGTNLDECARLSRIVGDVIEGTDLFSKGYNLEVSSPGLDRPLKTETDFRFRIGEKVRVSFAEKKAKKVTAEIVSVEDGILKLKNESGELTLNLSDVEQAKIIF